MPAFATGRSQLIAISLTLDEADLLCENPVRPDRIGVGRLGQSEEIARVVTMLGCRICVAGAIEGLSVKIPSTPGQRL